jgi:hypothetical protein
MLLTPHHYNSIVSTNDSILAADDLGTSVYSGLQLWWGDWVNINTVALTYPSYGILLNLNNNFESATTHNAYVQLGVGPSYTDVTIVVEHLCASHVTPGMGRMYYLPIRIEPSTGGVNNYIWARHLNSAASRNINVSATFFCGTNLPGTITTCSKIVALGLNEGSAVGTSITPGASGAEGSWTQIVASTTQDYCGLIVSGLYTTDTSLGQHLATSFDVGIGASGQEVSIGENISRTYTIETDERQMAFSVPTFAEIPTGSRLCVRASGNDAADSSCYVSLNALIA